MEGTDVAAVLLAGGASSRFDHELGKVYVPLAGRALLAHGLEALERSPVVDHVVLVIREGDRPACDEVVAAVGATKLRAVVVGGGTRHESETAGLDALDELPEVGWVMLHDAARPFITLDLLDRLVTTARERGVGVVPGTRFDDAVVDGRGRLVDTSKLITVQTPQVFPRQDVVVAYRLAAEEGFHGVDTAETVARYRDTPIEFVDGDPLNFKITTIEDLFAAEQLVGAWDAGRWTHPVAPDEDASGDPGDDADAPARPPA